MFQNKLAKINVWLVLILLLFLVTRFSQISSVPGSVYWDEASIGYNAYAVGVDLKDEWGETLPLHFRAFGEFKLPAYVYSVAVMVKLFGLNAFSVRAPAVLYSLGVVVLVYLLTKKFFASERVGLLSAFIMTITPWFFIFSRTGFEVTAGLFFFLLGIWLFFEKFKWSTLLGSVSFIGAMYSYNAFRIVVPLFVGVLVLREWKRLRGKKVELVVSGLLIALSVIPVVRLYVLDTGGVRLSTVGVGGLKGFFINYLSLFSAKFLFVEGDPIVRHSMAEYGQFFWLVLPLLLLGLVEMLKGKTKHGWLVLTGLLVSPIPAALTRESMHSLRSMAMVVFWVMIVGVGADYLVRLFKKQELLATVVLLGTLLASFGGYYFKFIGQYNDMASSEWQVEYKRQIKEGKTRISDEYGQPYIFALFYTKHDPGDFRETVEYNPISDWGFSTVSRFGEYEFYKE